MDEVTIPIRPIAQHHTPFFGFAIVMRPLMDGDCADRLILLTANTSPPTQDVAPPIRIIDPIDYTTIKPNTNPLQAFGLNIEDFTAI